MNTIFTNCTLKIALPSLSNNKCLNSELGQAHNNVLINIFYVKYNNVKIKMHQLIFHGVAGHKLTIPVDGFTLS